MLEYCFGLCLAGDGRMEIKRIFVVGAAGLGRGKFPSTCFVVDRPYAKMLADGTQKCWFFPLLLFHCAS